MDGIHRPSDDEFGGAERAAGTRRVEEGVAISVHGAGHHAALQGVLLRWGRRAETRGGEGVREPRTGGRGGGGGGGGRAHQFGDVILSRGGERLGGLPVGDGEREGQRGRGGTSGDARREDLRSAHRRRAGDAPRRRLRRRPGRSALRLFSDARVRDVPSAPRVATRTGRRRTRCPRPWWSGRRVSEGGRC